LQYHQDDLSGPPDKNPLESEGLKWGITHHPHSQKIMYTSPDSSSSKIKQSGKEKKAWELKWAKTILIEHVLLNSASTDVESLGGRPLSKIPNYYCKEAFMNQVGISISKKLCNNEGLSIAVTNL
jgi:hypothetical protein